MEALSQVSYRPVHTAIYKNSMNAVGLWSCGNSNSDCLVANEISCQLDDSPIRPCAALTYRGVSRSPLKLRDGDRARS
jgi:hypothetical protein